MRCPFCGYEESKVVNSRPTDDGERIRRRRECLQCQKRFTTYEVMETLPIIVVKKDGSRQAFDRDKLLRGLLRACEKRPVSLVDLERAASEIEYRSEKIGELAMEKLRELDEVAYVRFASVYRQFRDIDTFMDALRKLQAEK